MASISEDTGEETPLQVIEILNSKHFSLLACSAFRHFILQLTVIGTAQWRCNFYRDNWAHCCSPSPSCPLGQVNLCYHNLILLTSRAISNFYLKIFSLLTYFKFEHRYFTGTTTDANGKSQFTAGKTSIGDAINDVIKVITVAVCAILFSRFVMFIISDCSLINIRTIL